MTMEDYRATVMEGRTCVMFGRDGCAPCRQSQPIWETECERVGCDFVKVDITDSPEVTRDRAIRSVPVVILYEDGDVVDIVNGATRPDVIRARLERWT